MKKTAVAAAILLASFTANAQNESTSAQQAVQLEMSNALEITFTGSGSSSGSTVNMAFNNVNDYADGVESAQQELKVRSNKNFKVGVKIDYNTFNYSGTGNLNLATIPTNAFGLKVVGNSTGGSIAPAFSSTSYSPITDANKDVILNGNNGGDQKFAVKYKCTPGFGLPAGTYTFDVIYTATQQ